MPDIITSTMIDTLMQSTTTGDARAALEALGIVDLINDLTTGGADKALTAAQGVALKALVDAKFGPNDNATLNGDVEAAGQLTTTGNDLTDDDHVINVGQADGRYLVGGEFKISGVSDHGTQVANTDDTNLRVADVTSGELIIVSTDDLSALVADHSMVTLKDANGGSGTYDTFLVTEVGVIALDDDELSGSLTGDHYIKAINNGDEMTLSGAITSYAGMLKHPALFTQSNGVGAGGAATANYYFECRAMHRGTSSRGWVNRFASYAIDSSSGDRRAATQLLQLPDATQAVYGVLYDGRTSKAWVYSTFDDIGSNIGDYTFYATIYQHQLSGANEPDLAIPNG